MSSCELPFISLAPNFSRDAACMLPYIRHTADYEPQIQLFKSFTVMFR